eukprot:Lankesteria_metandrocarpae@DN2721_c0_g1_i1.p1
MLVIGVQVFSWMELNVDRGSIHGYNSWRDLLVFLFLSLISTSDYLIFSFKDTIVSRFPVLAAYLLCTGYSFKLLSSVYLGSIIVSVLINGAMKLSLLETGGSLVVSIGLLLLMLCIRQVIKMVAVEYLKGVLRPDIALHSIPQLPKLEGRALSYLAGSSFEKPLVAEQALMIFLRLPQIQPLRRQCFAILSEDLGDTEDPDSTAQRLYLRYALSHYWESRQTLKNNPASMPPLLNPALASRTEVNFIDVPKTLTDSHTKGKDIDQRVRRLKTLETAATPFAAAAAMRRIGSASQVSSSFDKSRGSFSDQPLRPAFSMDDTENFRPPQRLSTLSQAHGLTIEAIKIYNALCTIQEPGCTGEEVSSTLPPNFNLFDSSSDPQLSSDGQKQSWYSKQITKFRKISQWHRLVWSQSMWDSTNAEPRKSLYGSFQDLKIERWYMAWSARYRIRICRNAWWWQCATVWTALLMSYTPILLLNTIIGITKGGMIMLIVHAVITILVCLITKALIKNAYNNYDNDQRLFRRYLLSYFIG